MSEKNIIEVIKDKARFWLPPVVVSWLLWFTGIFATFLLSAANTNLNNGIIPPLSLSDAVNALWAAIGAAIAVAIQYLDKKYTRYGVNASNADEIKLPTVTEAPEFKQD
jgi:hypothetical protein